MKILVTGTEGYLGSLLAPLLMQNGHEVIGVDTGFYKVGWLYNTNSSTPKTLNKDLRHLTVEDFQGIDAVVHMAELSNDPAGQLAPHVTYEINHKGSVYLAKLAKAAGVRRFVYMSSCSVYGVATEDYVTEESPVNPQTAYAICKTLVEQDVKPLADDGFSPTFMRNATAYGASPRMRFDIVLNNLAGLAWTTKEIKMSSDGTPWRPLVHGLDICKAIICTLEAPRDLIHNQVFNVGDTTHNYQVKEIAQTIANIFQGCQLNFGDNGSDNRSYRVSFEKINQILPGFKCDWNAQRGAQQLCDLFKLIDMTQETFLFRGFTRLKQLEYLINTQQIDHNFFWKR
ncbi:NAD-dependent dehydratase [Aphanothece hegewaldii CCALA 016]|uniref:NAD-dependent dehydratase n=1 Tax=Aphanothece hegewaldii CCALA 016 TaxID=2107694 RepID=A0A2T1M1T0_9CHRO|nr:SDR family oxidoreductase [Aphanothece hegewaldii]PSF38663.1 NAD-dependent dehydratase [Aphanothece hegewaldii CCALA 016]